VTITGTNDTPYVQTEIADQHVNEDNAWSFTVPAGSFADPDTIDTLTYSATLANGDPLPGWLSFDAATHSFSGTPPQDFNGTIGLKVTATDGGSLSASDTFDLIVAAVNDAPVATITPTTYNATEQANLNLHGTGLSISDVDAASGSMTVTLSVTQGILNVAAGTTGAIVSNSGTSSVTITGTQTQINDLLAGNSAATVVYNDNTDTPASSATLTLTVHDNGNTGGGDLSSTDTATINITAVNDAPVNSTLPGAQTIGEDASLTFSAGNGNAIKVSDVDLGGGNLTVTLSVAHGALSLGGTSGLLFVNGDGTADATMTFVGTQSAINAAMQGLLYTPVADFNGSDTLTITTNDNGNTGTGGALQDVDTVAITINPVADIVSDSVTVTAGPNNLDLLSNDTFENPGRFISAVGAATHGTVTINDNGTPGNTTDDFVVYTPTAGYSGSDSFTYTVTSGGVTETATANVTVSGPTAANIEFVPNGNDFNTALPNPGDQIGSFVAFDATGNAIPGATFSVTAGSTGSLTVDSSGLVSGGLANGDTFDFSVTSAGVTETVHVQVGNGTANNISGTGNDIDILFGFNNSDTLSGGSNDDTLYGNNDTDTLNGGDNNDFLIGGNANDTLNGGNGNDYLRGGIGNDVLNGGTGNDLFVFNVAPSATNSDTIQDFNASGVDHIGLDHSIFSAIGTTLDATEFRASAGGNAADANDYILYDTATGNLYYDADGSGGGAKVLIATVSLPGLTGTVDPTDFIML
jgi:Ca2+-binding RTX toxin-like protein